MENRGYFFYVLRVTFWNLEQATQPFSGLKQVKAGLETLSTGPSVFQHTPDLMKKLYAVYQKVNSTSAPGKGYE